MPPKQSVRLKGQQCLDYWTSLCNKEEKGVEVPLAAMEAGLIKRFPQVEEWATKLIVAFAMAEKPGKATVTVEEFDHFVRRFRPFEECIPLAVAALIDKQTKFFHPWFHGFLKAEFSSDATKQFYVRLSSNTQPSQAQGEASVIPAHCLVLHYKKVKNGKVNIAIRLINRHKIEGRYQYQPSSDERSYDSFADLIKIRMTDQGYGPLSSALQKPAAGTPVPKPVPETARAPSKAVPGAAPATTTGGGTTGSAGMYHSQLSIEELKVGGKEKEEAPKQATPPAAAKCEGSCQGEAQLWCGECGLMFCAACAQKDHSKGSRVNHRLEKLVLCEECSKSHATKHCDECRISFCAPCCTRYHSRGQILPNHVIRDK